MVFKRSFLIFSIRKKVKSVWIHTRVTYLWLSLAASAFTSQIIWMDSTQECPTPPPLHPSSTLCIGFHFQCLIRAGLYPVDQSELHKAEPLLCKYACQAHHKWGGKMLFRYWPVFPFNIWSVWGLQGHRPWVGSPLCKGKDQLWLGNPWKCNRPLLPLPSSKHLYCDSTLNSGKVLKTTICTIFPNMVKTRLSIHSHLEY